MLLKARRAQNKHHLWSKHQNWTLIPQISFYRVLKHQLAITSPWTMKLNFNAELSSLLKSEIMANTYRSIFQSIFEDLQDCTMFFTEVRVVYNENKTQWSNFQISVQRTQWKFFQSTMPLRLPNKTTV